jgi:hypothetical protein
MALEGHWVESDRSHRRMFLSPSADSGSFKCEICDIPHATFFIRLQPFLSCLFSYLLGGHRNGNFSV